MYLVASPGQGEMESQGMALKPASEVTVRPFLDEEGDLELPRRRVGGEGELVQCRREGEEIERPVMSVRAGHGFEAAGS